jgi:hypothetical protein
LFRTSGGKSLPGTNLLLAKPRWLSFPRSVFSLGAVSDNPFGDRAPPPSGCGSLFIDSRIYNTDELYSGDFPFLQSIFRQREEVGKWAIQRRMSKP